ncbi:hypothetical protein BKA62DRAFT_683065 [Auriculariales sp. MPI-PUGE-AT-0066]|nr:hypothetical protein BKA62DRAFT_683065 [Auriculariales sp. MPI-PUGE-AT-0066]
MDSTTYNANPVIFATSATHSRPGRAHRGGVWEELGLIARDSSDSSDEDDGPEPIDATEIYDLVRSITDPEHTNLTLEQLRVVNAEDIAIAGNSLLLEFTPTVPHCGMSTLIGLSIRVRLMRSLPQRFKVDIKVKPGTHASELSVNRQLNDKERVAAALENDAIVDVVERCLATAHRRGRGGDECC